MRASTIQGFRPRSGQSGGSVGARVFAGGLAQVEERFDDVDRHREMMVEILTSAAIARTLARKRLEFTGGKPSRAPRKL
jgi:hypothetical protein